MNKIQLHQQLMIHLQQLLNNAKSAAKRAHETATNEENIAENKYDTLALEAGYLAQGQSQRVTQCLADLEACVNLPMSQSTQGELGALMVLVDANEQAKYVLICPVAGGVKLQWDQHSVLVITPQSPLGSALLNQQEDDQVSVAVANKLHTYDILQIL
jgi:transcription elongation GreA/GreB family factor